jgi:hypothetical protein
MVGMERDFERMGRESMRQDVALRSQAFPLFLYATIDIVYGTTTNEVI